MMTESMTARLKPLQPGRTSLVAVLDIGSTKICCVIARLTPRAEGKALKGRTHVAEVIGFGYGPSSGVKSGVVTDLDKAEQAVRSVVGMAERAAGLTVESVIVNVTAGRLGSETFSATVSLGGQEVERSDLQRVLRAVNDRSVRPERSIIHALPIGYTLDGQKGIRDPRGMVGEKLSIDVAVVSAEMLAMRNIELVLNRCHLQIEALMATPYASGLATLVDDEAHLGVACVDFGGATTTVSVFSEGHVVYTDAIAIGGHHLTLDLARQLSVSVADAERLKCFYGSVLPGQADERDMIPIQPVGASHDEAPGQVARSVLTRIMRPRIEEILTAIRDRMQATGMMDMCGRRFVLTGGGSELTGLPEVARRILARNVRNGRPMGIAGLPEIAKGAAFATVGGLLIYPQVCGQEYVEPRGGHRLTGTDGYFARVGSWLRSSF
ncbi:cell division protein FtsA [Paradevosia shaoguanensis]|jgi:cell division protein FtsA|uniref:Cell division protein FtsA n=1 Tax=Paradevosia shaoguanensis TaxID=1335043 RepID=A0AA41QNE6_9HYPH|nr:cell division protein FtsA [Paradevosia shaoguanensis]MCF1743336.1 cell division protein FtsA [Paradevosia shaoguanensis]MCI0127819.1 cell division protein FtsA [Paradevosia shaoguanensis]QMV01335.1 cell division protein FtsA [Devosia sp. D6-9]CDP52569.1 Cell division protein FtsA [Devosia sp. DBB001]